MEGRKFYCSLKPLIYTTNILNLSNLKMNGGGNRLEISYPNLIYNVIVAGVLFACFIYAGDNAVSDLDESSNSISQATDLFELYSGMCTQTTAILMMCVNTKKFVDFFHRFNVVDKKIFLLGQKISSRNNRMFVVSGICLVFVEFTITIFPDYLFFFDNETVIYVITSYYSIIPNGLFKVQMITLVYLLWQRFFAVNSVLKKLKWKVKDDRRRKRDLFARRSVKTRFRNETVSESAHATSVATIHNIFNELCQLLNLINYLYGIQLLLAMGSAFAIAARQIHSSYDVLKDMDVPYPILDVYFSCQWALVQILEIFAIIIVAERTHREIKEIAFNLHSLYHVSLDREELKIEVREFSSHMTHNDVKFNVCGFFDIDYSLITAMFSAITSYIVIIIQADIAKENIANDGGTRNGTYLFQWLRSTQLLLSQVDIPQQL